MAVLLNQSIAVHRISLSLGGESASAVGISQQGIVLEIRREGHAGILGADDVQIGRTDNCGTAVYREEPVAFLHHIVALAVIFNGATALANGQHGLGLEQRGILVGKLEIAVLGILRNAHIFLVLISLRVKQLILAIGADPAAQEGEQEHHYQNRQSHNGQPVAEEPLGHQRAGGKHLNPAVVVQGVFVILIGRVGSPVTALFQQPLRMLPAGRAGHILGP